MVFSGLLSSSGDRTAKPKPLRASASANSLLSQGSGEEPTRLSDFIADESHLQPPEPEHPDLRDLNTSLEALVAVFPDVQIDVFREMLSSFDGESRLALVADALLKNRATWVKGRWRVAEKEAASSGSERTEELTQSTSLIPKSEAFKSPEYKNSVKNLALQEFKGLSKSTIKAVLAESNHSYLDARRTLVDLSSKSWRFTISAVLFRRKPVASSEAESHPLVIWKSTGLGSIIPCLKSTGNADLDRELYLALIRPIRDKSRVSQEQKDRSLAMDLNLQEAEEADSTHECACCFTSATFEEFTSCGAHGHMICFRCVQHSLSEAVFGQGWHRSIDKTTGTLRCPAVDSDECQGSVPSDHMWRAMLEEKKGAEVMHKLEQRLAEHSLLASNLPLIRCPFCDYAEVDDMYVPADEAPLRIRIHSIYSLAILLVVLVAVLPLLVTTVLFSSLVALILSAPQMSSNPIKAQFGSAILRYRRRRRGLKFTCGNPDCRRPSCLNCNKAWIDVHVCHESELVALRTQVEQAMSMAIKRVCPRCNTSFVKTAGCNKLTCPCGYKMCYVCRKDIGGDGDGPDVGYRHFCDHFRPTGDPTPCTQCSKCNLWESENTEEVLQQAKEEAEQKWRESEKRALSGAEKAFLETGVAAQSPRGVERVFHRSRWPTVSEVCDMIVENILA
ncbi:hypothetical protein GQ53DRAFT_730094 [Thozetella sp. PMI_491]|nr:hypothetical protein GQ53DRAFT_730094 [Thozetella sp. PMI_491]